MYYWCGAFVTSCCERREKMAVGDNLSLLPPEYNVAVTVHCSHVLVAVSIPEPFDSVVWAFISHSPLSVNCRQVALTDNSILCCSFAVIIITVRRWTVRCQSAVRTDESSGLSDTHALHTQLLSYVFVYRTCTFLPNAVYVRRYVFTLTAPKVKGWCSSLFRSSQPALSRSWPNLSPSLLLSTHTQSLKVCCD